MEAIISLFQAFGISAPAGLNAYLTLLIVGLMARSTDLIKLNKPYDLLTNEWVLFALAFLLLIEVFVDKIPGVDTVNDIIGTVIRPAAGAVLFASSTNAITEINPILAMVVGLLAAGSVHAVKATARPLVSLGTAGLGNALVSVVEDLMAALIAILAIVVPVLGIIIFLLFATLALLWYVRRRQRRVAQSAA